jgi:vacuolar-type H+-ATPase subunit H
MAFEILSNIREEEKKASALLLDAQHSANEIVKNAEAHAAEKERKAAVENRALYQRLLEEHRALVTGKLMALQSDEKAKAEASIRDAQSRLSIAVKSIVSEVLHGAG